MVVILLATEIDADIWTCFNMARSLSVHSLTTSWSNERVVSGPAHDLVVEGDVVTFEATHLGVRQRLTSRISMMDAPTQFVDEMLQGAFRHLHHTHRFEQTGNRCIMHDRLEFSAPLGPLGWIAEGLILRRYMTSFLSRRCQAIKRLAEQNTDPIWQNSDHEHSVGNRLRRDQD